MGVHDGHRQRLKERFLTQGLSGFEDHNVLELLLFYSIPRCDTNEIAHRLLEEFGSLDRVFDAPAESLCRVKGISAHSASLIKLIPELFSRYHTDKADKEETLNSTKALGKYFVPRFYGKTKEEFHAVFLDDRKKVIKCEKISEGEANVTKVDAKKLITSVVNTNATAVAIAHNHPRGVCIPSHSDLMSTELLYNSLRLINVELLDHIVVSGDDYTSMADRGDFMRFKY